MTRTKFIIATIQLGCIAVNIPGALSGNHDSIAAMFFCAAIFLLTWRIGD